MADVTAAVDPLPGSPPRPLPSAHQTDPCWTPLAHRVGIRHQGLPLLVAERNIAFLELADRVCVLEEAPVRLVATVGAVEGNRAVGASLFGTVSAQMRVSRGTPRGGLPGRSTARGTAA
ncbi:MAG: hypothetical protein ACYDD0_10320 [Candidatus Dormibacteria bacterium]